MFVDFLWQKVIKIVSSAQSICSPYGLQRGVDDPLWWGCLFFFFFKSLMEYLLKETKFQRQNESDSITLVQVA